VGHAARPPRPPAASISSRRIAALIASRLESDEPQVAGNMRRTSAADILFLRLGLPRAEEGEPAAGLASSCWILDPVPQVTGEHPLTSSASPRRIGAPR
jgi:hypothetical protein